jgi:hypothetical protein
MRMQWEHTKFLARFASAMLDLVDLLLLRRGIPADDREIAFRRIDGNPASTVIYFLPWCTPFVFAHRAGFTPLDFLACYEMPIGIVSSEPELCVQAMLGLVSDAERLLKERDVKAGDAVIVGLSAGTYPATYLANRVGGRLFSVASADRGDLAIWQSPATRIIKNRAVKRGLSLKHYSRALSGSHPAENLTGIAPNSVFMIGKSDPYVPPDRKRGLLRAIETHAQDANVIELDAGHFKTLMVSGRCQRRLLGRDFARRTWRLPVPFWRAASDSHTAELPSLNAS